MDWGKLSKYVNDLLYIKLNAHLLKQIYTNIYIFCYGVGYIVRPT